jgi:hypothetical protein
MVQRPPRHPNVVDRMAHIWDTGNKIFNVGMGIYNVGKVAAPYIIRAAGAAAAIAA